MRTIPLLALGMSIAGTLSAQANTVVGLNGRLEVLDNITYWGRRGAAYPGGEVGLSMRNTMCNPGSVNIPWFAAMAEDHPKFGFLITRLQGDRMVQISDWSYCKHAFTSASGPGACGPCNGVGGSYMGVTCSDTYNAFYNGDRTLLGPPSEIDPWLGTWNHTGSYFDRGDPDVGAPGNTDGNRSLTATMTNAFDVVKNRVTVKESDLNQSASGALYFYGIQLVHQGEAVANRGDNIKSRGFTPTWNGTTWSVANSGVGETFGSILQHWPGADLNSGSNGADDGRFFVASKATPLGGGVYHYEYAVHNVDNSRGAATFRVPIDAGATATNFTFRDIDGNPLNDWPASRVGNEIVFLASAANPLNWNTIYNFGFDATFAPGTGIVELDEARPGAGTLAVAVGAKCPCASNFAFVQPVGVGCGGFNCQTSFYEVFSPAATFDLANTSVTLTYNAANGYYTAGPGVGTYVAPAGSSVAMGDDVETATVIPFSLPYPGGSTSVLWVCSNGFVSPVSNGASYVPSVTAFLAGAPRWAAMWHDFVPTTGMVLVDATAARVVVSYVAVPSYSVASTAATFQYQFFPNGNVNIVYQSVVTGGNDYLTGWTVGGGVSDPGSVNISNGFGGGLSLCATTLTNMTLATSARPVLGSTFAFNTGNIPAGTVLGLSILSLTEYPAGVDLTGLGMPGCFLYLGLDSLITFPVAGSTNSLPYTLPATPALSGVLLLAQSASLTPGINAFGFATSNGLELTLGIN